MNRPLIDIVVAAHDPRRQVGRAVGSVLGSRAGDDVRVTVVAHNQPRAAFGQALAAFATDRRLRVIELSDGLHSPAGPFNAGLDAATADYVGLLGSDDYLEPGAIAAWAQHVRRWRPDYLMAAIREDGGPLWREPLLRYRRVRRLDPVRDRLDYRTAPLGLLRREFVADLGVRLTPTAATGEDIELGLAACNRGYVDAGVGMPAYVIGRDAPERVTLIPRPFHEEAIALVHLAAAPWPWQLSIRQRRAIAIKLWRTSVVTAVRGRPDASAWAQNDVRSLLAVGQWLSELAPDATGYLSIPEAMIAGVVCGIDADEPEASARDVARAARLRSPRFAQLIAARPWLSLAVDSRARRLVRLALPR
ncbi:glycosyltransferase family 2 protein [Rarobacter incanus]|uniref:Glycosyl transferase family 2 n=1 Tax=Rarobacter incanus TaxID=153494 RepID=A0A542SNV6_9MICO|nr:glycosyltransferase [Rarobacter incanus]TQK76238.1 glycosyl transferase family 2 [Rarobacter incanus]